MQSSQVVTRSALCLKRALQSFARWRATSAALIARPRKLPLLCAQRESTRRRRLFSQVGKYEFSGEAPLPGEDAKASFAVLGGSD